MFKTIVAPVDGSGPSENALRYASGLAKEYGANLILVHVLLRGTSVPVMQELAEEKGFLGEVTNDLTNVETIPIATVAGVAAPMEVISDGTLEKFGHLLLDKAEAEVQGVEDVQKRIVDGDPAKAILDCVDDEHADLLVIGSHGVGDLKSLLLGSVSHKLIEDAKCPCLVVK